MKCIMYLKIKWALINKFCKEIVLLSSEFVRPTQEITLFNTAHPSLKVRNSNCPLPCSYAISPSSACVDAGLGKDGSLGWLLAILLARLASSSE